MNNAPVRITPTYKAQLTWSPRTCVFRKHRGTTRMQAPRRRPTRLSSSARRAAKEPHEPEPPPGGLTRFQKSSTLLRAVFDYAEHSLGDREWRGFLEEAAIRTSHEAAKTWWSE